MWRVDKRTLATTHGRNHGDAENHLRRVFCFFLKGSWGETFFPKKVFPQVLFKKIF